MKVGHILFHFVADVFIASVRRQAGILLYPVVRHLLELLALVLEGLEGDFMRDVADGEGEADSLVSEQSIAFKC